MLRICERCGCPNNFRRRDWWCHDCGALLPMPTVAIQPRLLAVVRVLVGVALVLLILVVCVSLTGCAGAPFTSREALENSSAGAGGDIKAMSEAGAGGRDDGRCNDETQSDPPNDAGAEAGAAGSASVGGRGCDQGSAGGVDDGPGNGTGGAGANGGGGGTSGACGGGACAGRGGMGTGGSSGAASAGRGGSGELGGSGGCLTGWQASACDVCTSSPAPSSGRACAEVLDCYAHGVPADCDYSGPTQDHQVELAHQVAACRCGGSL